MSSVSAVRIGQKLVGPGRPCYVVAEAGVNHNGQVDLARRLIDAAAAAGADAVKFQSFHADHVASALAPKAAYQVERTTAGQSQLEMLRHLELAVDDQRRLYDHARARGITFLSTPFDRRSVDLLSTLGVPAFKVSSGDLTNRPFLAHVARQGAPVILSTGMAHLGEVDDALRVVREAGCDDVILLHCVTSYPADPGEANLRAIQTLAAAFGLPVGYSDHTLGMEVAIASVAVGACLLEKHLTLDRDLPGPDHHASLTPEEFGRLVANVRLVSRALGDGRKRPAPSELPNRDVVRRSLAAAAPLAAGTVVSAEMLTTLRPATGISPMLHDLVVGRRLRRTLARGELLQWSDLE